MSKRGEEAYNNFLKGYNCAQAVLLAMSDVTGLDKETTLRITSGYGGGIGRTRSVCGTVNGMVMAANMICGCVSPSDSIGKQRINALVQELLEEFKKQNGSIICAELLGLKPMENPEFAGRKKRPCPLLCKDAAEILEKHLM